MGKSLFQKDKQLFHTFALLKHTHVWMAFHFLDKDMMKKIITTMIRPKLEYAEVIWSPHKKKHVL